MNQTKLRINETLARLRERFKIRRLISRVGNNPRDAKSISRLGEFGPKKVVPHLIGMLKKDFIDKNENALKTIELLKWKEIIPDSIILLKSPWPVKRANAIRALRNTQSIEAIPHLVAMLGDQKCSDELEDALLKFDFHKTIPPIFEALNSYRENYDTLAFLGTSGPRFLTKNRLIYGALDFLGKYRPRILKNYGRFSQNQPEYVALLHINPFTHPKSFIKLYGEAQKKPRKSPEYWKLEAKQLMAMERRLK